MQPQELSIVSTPRPLLDSDLSTVRVSQFHQRASTTYRQQPFVTCPIPTQMTVMATDQQVELVFICATSKRQRQGSTSATREQWP